MPTPNEQKIVINDKFGGFNLSDEAFELYLNKKGVKFYKYPTQFPSIMGYDYYAVPKEEYDAMTEKSLAETGNYKLINEKNWYLSARDVDRDDPVLVEVVEELGDKANTRFSKLKIVSIPASVEWEIDEYDGLEKVEEKHRSWS